MSFLSGTARSARLFAFVSLLSCLALFWPDAARAAHTSLLCGPQTVHVPSGGSVAINVTACAGGNIFLAGDGPVDGTVPPKRGSAILRVVDPNWYVDYSHNGIDTTGDVFEFSDTANRTVRVTMVIDPPASSIVVSPATLYPMTAGTTFAQALTATGGTSPYTYTTNTAQLPPGITLSSAGVLAGTPTRRGVFSFTVRATDNTGAVVDKAYALTVQNPSLSLSQTSATAVQNVPFSLTLSGQGGVAPYTIVLESGTLPAGISLVAGVLSGTPTGAVQGYPVTFRVTDSSAGAAPYFELESFTLNVSSAPSVSIAVAPSSVLEDSGLPLVYTVTRSASLPTPITVNLTTSGTATSGDYTGAVPSVVIPANATSATVSITPVADTAVETNEAVIVTVMAGAGYTVGTPAAATGTILNDDLPVATIAVSPASVNEDSGMPLVYTITLDRSNPIPLTISIGVGGTGIFDTDYTGALGAVVIPAGSTTGTISLVPIADNVAEANKTVVITLLSNAAYTLGTPASATGTIRDDDMPALSVSNVSQIEGNSGTSSFTFTVGLSSPAGPGGVTFDIATANNTAVAGADYVASSLSGQSIPAGSQTYAFTVQVNGDMLYEANETFLVKVSNVVGATVATTQGIGTIIDDDPPPSLSIADASVTEGNSGTTPAMVTVTLSAPSGLPTSVLYATLDGTAVAPGDYTATSGSLTIAAGMTVVPLQVPVIGDTAVEPDEAFQVRLSNPLNATLDRATATVTVLTDDQPMVLTPASLPAAVAGNAYSQTLVTSGGFGPYAYLVIGSLPAGLNLHPTTGVLSGTPTTAGTATFLVRVTDSTLPANAVVASYTVSVMPPVLTLPNAALPAAVRGQPYTSNRGPVAGGVAPYTFSTTTSSLPPGLALSSAGVLSGTPTQAGSYTFTVTAADSTLGIGAPFMASETLTLVVGESAPVAGDTVMTLSYGDLPRSVTTALSGGPATQLTVVTPPQHGTVVLGASLSMTYQPTPGYAGQDTFTYTATGPGGTSAPATVTITVGNPTILITPSGGFTAQAGMPYSQTFTWAGGAGPFTGYSVTGLPPGVSLTATTVNSATISGTPTASGSFALVVAGTDSSTGNGPFTVGQAFALTVDRPTLSATPTTLPGATAGSAYRQVISATGGVAPYQVVLSGLLPTGMRFDAATGTLSGTPTQSGTFTLNATLSDSTSGTPASINQAYILVVASPTLSTTPATLPGATAGSAYQQVIGAIGGIAPYQVALTGTLPVGVNFDAATGRLSGTPTQSGTFALSATVTDSTTGTPASVTQPYSLVVASPTLLATPATLADATAGSSYQQAITASGGIAPYQVVVSGALPVGVNFDAATGTLSGTPTQSGTFALTATITDSTTGTPASVSQPYSLVVASPVIVVTPATLPAGTAGSVYQRAITATGGIAPYQVALSGTLPTGVTFDAGTGTLSGTPLQSGTFTLTATITDSTGGTPASTTQTYSLVVASPALSATPATLPAGIAGSPYQQAITASGGIAPYQVALSGTLPTGVTFDAGTGTLSGTPTQSGEFALTVTITDSTAGTAASLTQPYSLVVTSPVLVATPVTLATAAAGTPYQQAITATGGIAPYRVVLSGTLPTGLSFDTGSGTLSGTPTQSGSFVLSATVTDSTGGNPASLVQAYTLTVAVPALTLTPVAGALPASSAGSNYTLAFTTQGGLAPYRYTLTTGALPTGLVLDAATGRVAGTPSVAGSFAFSVTVTDATAGGAGSLTQAYTLSVAAPVLVLTPASLPAGLFASRYEQALTATGGTAPYRYAVSAGALPDGITLEAAGLLAGTPTAAGAFAFAVTVTDAQGFTGSQNYVVQIAQRPDPTRDPEVRGLLSAQRDAARRFANSQIENFQQRMQRLHGASGSNGFSNNLSLAYGPQRCDPAVGSLPGTGCDAQRRQPFDREPGLDAPAGVESGSQAPLGLWVGGTVRTGRSNGRGSGGSDFNTDGVTLGSDLQVTRDLAVGAGLGYGRDRSDVGENGSRSDGQAFTLAMYASYSPGDHLFVDALLGHQLLDYDLRRYVTSDGGFVHARRNGSQWFGSLSFGADLVRNSWLVTPYARLDASRGRLDPYVEQGSELFALRYGDQDVDTTTGNAGVRMEMRNTTVWGAWTPQLRVEYQRDFKGNGAATMQYADLVGVPFYRDSLDAFDHSRWMLGAGVMFDLRRNWGLHVDYRGLVGSGEDRDHGVQVSLDKQL